MNKRILKNDHIQLEYLTNSFRITGLLPVGKTNLFADLSDYPQIPTPYGDFHFLGGHRLWHAPEAMPRTYIPDSAEITISDISGGVMMDGSAEPGTGIHKRIERPGTYSMTWIRSQAKCGST